VGHPPIVCIVEDDTSLRDALARLLRGYGFEVEAFARPDEVLRRLEAGSLHCTVLVLDIHLDEMSGFDLHDRLTKMGVSIPTIFMTGGDDPSHRERVSQIGATAYLVKPFEDLAFVDAITVALQKR
jgi:two-component system, LuxR family, response regulator FixJ